MDYKDYYEQGYQIIEDVLSVQECERYIKIAENFTDSEFKEIHNLERKAWPVEDLIKDKRITDPVKAILGDNIAYLGSMFHFRRPGTKYADGSWLRHQDNGYVKAPYGTMLTVHIVLNDMMAENGGVWMLAGSHKEAILPHWTTIDYIYPFTFKLKRFIPRFAMDFKQANSYTRHPLVIKRGSICLQAGNLIHGSYPNMSEQSRETMGIMYVKQGVKFNRGLFLQRKATLI